MSPRPAAEPMCYASSYSMHLYCDHVNDEHPFDSFPHEYSAETFGQCAAMARRRGWVFHYKTRTATCPLCVQALSRRSVQPTQS